MSSQTTAITVLVILAGLYLAGQGGRFVFSDQPGNRPKEIEEKIENDEFDPAEEFPFLAKIGALSTVFASGLRPEPGKGLIANGCRLRDGLVILTEDHPRCPLTIDRKTVTIGPGKEDVEQVVMKVIARTRARVFQVNHSGQTLDGLIPRLCNLPANAPPSHPTLFVLYKQKGSKTGCEPHPDLSKPVIVAIDNYSPLTLICRGCTSLPRGQLKIAFK